MKKILITGGAGFIGSNIAKKYYNEGFQVAVLDNFSSGQKEFLNKDIKIFKGNIENRDFVETVFKNFQPDIVSHHAAHISVRDSISKPIFDAEQNILGSINIFEIAGKNKIKHIVFASTAGLINQKDYKLPTIETNAPTLDLPYKISKFSGERYLEFFAEKYKYEKTIFRYGNVYGPHQTPKSEAGVVSIFIKNLLNKKNITLFGEGKQTRDFIFVEDIANAHFTATKKKVSGCFHLGTSIETSIKDLYEKITKELNIKYSPSIGELLSGELLRSCLNYEKFQKASGWTPQITLDEGLRKTIEWSKKVYLA